tara:strand:+ start:154 stop:465 length:312 start_codon:yes stop_codon:yes gene_type:complete
MEASNLIEDAAANYSEWHDVPSDEKIKIYLTQAKEDDELWESMFNQDEKYECHGEKLMADMLEFGLLKDYAKFRAVFFSNLDSYYHDTTSDKFLQARERWDED